MADGKATAKKRQPKAKGSSSGKRSSVMPRRQSGIETRAGLLKAAEKLAAKMSIAKVTVQHVADLAGVSRATFYLYFDNISEIYLDLARRACEDLYLVAGQGSNGRGPRESIDHATRSFVSGFREQAAAMRVLYSLAYEDDRFAELLRASQRAFLGRIEHSIERGISDGVFRDVDPRISANALGGMVEWFCVQELDQAPKGPIDRVSDALGDLWFHAIIKDPDKA
jgi:AcrR family transcriptional regulator